MGRIRKNSAVNLNKEPMGFSALKLSVSLAGIYSCYIGYGYLQEKVSQGLCSATVRSLRSGSKELKEMVPELKGVAVSVSFDTQVSGDDSSVCKGVVTEVKSDRLIVQSKSATTTEVFFDSKCHIFPASASLWSYYFPSLFYLSAMFLSNQSLNHVSYPTQALVKSTKMIPVMLFGVIIMSIPLFSEKRYRLAEYIRVFLIAGGIVMFNLFASGMKSSKGTVKSDAMGYLLLGMSLIADGIVGPLEDRLVHKYRLQSHNLMIGLNLWSVLISFGCLSFSSGFLNSLKFLQANPALAQTILVMSVLSALGQNFVMFTIQNFGSLVTSTITTTRKFFTILFSVFFYRHHIESLQWLGVFVVFTSLGWELLSKASYRNKKTESALIPDSTNVKPPKSNGKK